MGKIKFYFICAIFYFSWLSLCFSQTVTLKSGQVVEGKIVEQTDQYIKLEFQGVVLVFYRDEIASIFQAPVADEPVAAEQIKRLYQRYIASLNSPKELVKKPSQESAPLSSSGKTLADQLTQATKGLASQDSSNYSQWPVEYQEMIKSILDNLPTGSPPVVKDSK